MESLDEFFQDQLHALDFAEKQLTTNHLQQRGNNFQRLEALRKNLEIRPAGKKYKAAFIARMNPRVMTATLPSSGLPQRPRAGGTYGLLRSGGTAPGDPG